MQYLRVNDINIPILGLGTYKIKGYDLCYQVIDNALKLGYRLFDTAQVYKNEADLGICFEALLPKYKLERSQIFIITKIATCNHADKCADSLNKSLENLKTNYIDLVYIHWPGVKGLKLNDAKNLEMRKETWKVLEKYYSNGIVKWIGVSNYNLRHLNELMSFCTIKPHFLQNEFHPLCNQNQIVKYCFDNSIIFQAYSSLGTSDSNQTKKLVENETIKQIATKHSKTCAQILLRWPIQKNISVIPKASSYQHLRENIEIFDFELDEFDMKAIENLNEGEHLCWNPDTVL